MDAMAIELHRHAEVITRRSPGQNLRVWAGPGRPGTRAGLLLIKCKAVARQIDIDIEAAQCVGAENAVEFHRESPLDIKRCDRAPVATVSALLLSSNSAARPRWSVDCRQSPASLSELRWAVRRSDKR